MKEEKEKKQIEAPKDSQGAEVAIFFNDGDKTILSGVDIAIPQILIAHQTGTYIMPDLSAAQTFKGVILHAHNIRAFWPIPFEQSGGGEPPSCFSMDGIAPEYNSQAVEAPKCAQCPKSTFNEKEDGTKWVPCRMKKRLYILMDNTLIPYRLTLPVMSGENFNQYGSNLIAKGVPYQAVVTLFSLASSRSKIKNIPYYKTAFQQGETLTPGQIGGVVEAWKKWMPIIQKETVTSQELED